MSEECRRSLACFGGSVSVHVGGSDRGRTAQAGAAHAGAQLAEIHARLSRFIAESELSRFNHDPRETVPASMLMRRLAAAVVGAGHRSGGLVDATRLAPLERLGYRSSFEGMAAVPLPTALARAPRRRPAEPDPARRWRAIRIDDSAGTVTRPPGVRLDSGGIAKGLAADLIAAGLRGYPTYAVDCAGDISIGGAAGLARRVEVADPFGGESLHELELAEGAVATSGIGRRAWLRADGTAAHHLIDPGTGEPAYTGVVQATALAPTAALAETLAKLAVLSGPERFWITSRAAGTAALVTSSLSVAFGILLSRRRTSSEMSSGDLRAIHEALSLMTLGLIGLHGVVLLGDSFLQPGLVGIAIPFAGPYRPAWTALGIIAGYGLAALGLSYYIRDRIGPGRWRQLHRFTALFWLLGAAHSLGAGSDAGRAWFLLIAGLAVVPASILLLGRIGRGVGQFLDLPRREPPLREAP